jgi:hypothetical protein
MMIRRTFIGAMAAVVVAGFLIGPRYLSGFAVSEVKAAVQKTQTWHFSGWRIQDGRKVRWEVWGRRTPYFYHEQIGGEILIDDGKQRLRIFPAGGESNRPRPVVLKMPSEPLMESTRSLVDQHRAFLIGIGGEDTWLSFRGTERKGGTAILNSPGITFGNIGESARMTVDMATRLPRRFEIIQTRYKTRPHWMANSRTDPVDKTWTQASLEAAYGQPLPPEVMVLPTTETATMIDLAEKPEIAKTAPDGVASDRGLTFTGKAVAMDSEAAIHLRFKGWLGREPEDYRRTGILLNVAPEGSPYPGDRYARDEKGRLFLSVERPLGRGGNSDWYFVPLKPLSPGEPLPRTLTVWLIASASTLEWIPELRSNRSVSINGARLEITVRLPETLTATDYDTAFARKGVDYGGHRASLAEKAAHARGHYYFTAGVHSINPNDPRRVAATPEETIALLDQSVRWHEAAAVEAEKDRPDGLRTAKLWRQNAAGAKRRRDELQKQLQQSATPR